MEGITFCVSNYYSSKPNKGVVPFMPQSYILQRSLPEAVGISSSALTTFLEAVDTNQLGLHSFMLLRQGKVAAEAWWSPYGPDRPHMMFSLSKSFTSTAIGLAVSEDRLSVDDDVLSFFPENKPFEDAHLNKMRVKHLLSMSTGHAKDTTSLMHDHKDGDWVQAFLELPVEHEPGTHFVYNSGASYMLSAIIQKLTGQTVHEYLQPRLFEPLGIQGSVWETCPRGISAGGWGLSLKTEDIARFGQLYLQKGVWNGKRILPEAWVEEATSFQVSNGDGGESDWKQGYGYQFWRCRHGVYRGDGAFGQFCVVLQKQEVVIAITAGTKSMQNVLNLIWEHLLPAMADGPLPTDELTQTALADKIASLAYAPLCSDARSPLAEQVSGKRYVMQENERKVLAATVHFDADECLVTLWNRRGETHVRCGLGHWVEGDTYLTRQPSRMVASGMWQSPDTFVMSWRLVETPFSDTLTCLFEEDRVSIRIDTHVKNVGSTEPVILHGKLE
jgi:CubicO group peptidase (beta-lactamase class C family)